MVDDQGRDDRTFLGTDSCNRVCGGEETVFKVRSLMSRCTLNSVSSSPRSEMRAYFFFEFRVYCAKVCAYILGLYSL